MASKYALKRLELLLYLPKRLQLLGDFVPQPPYHVLHFRKIKQFPDIQFLISIFLWTGQLNMVWTMQVIIYFKCFPQICTKMNNFKFDFWKISWGGAYRAPSPDPSPVCFSGFALGSGFALNSQALRAFDLGFALDTRALRALDSGYALNFGSENMVWPPPK